ncbi:MAG TPA: glucokinase [Beijerinckiaceae bacterium]|nr:glucokinase [Beijerinckiaceae bacterium]
MRFPHPALVCDIGGTNTRVAILLQPGESIDLLAHLKTADFPDLGAAIEAALKSSPAPAKTMIACGAGPITGRSLHLTNAAWTIDGPALADRLGLTQGLLLNDFEAQALSLPALRSEWLRPIGEAVSDASGTRVVLGPGTGLGVAALLLSQGRFLPLSSEAGHMGFGPSSADEEQFWPHLERVDGRISAEAVISGPGLVRVHKARAAAAGRPIPQIDGVAIVDRALQAREGEEAQTVRAFWRLVARFAGDMAITFLARGGVTFGGGVLPRMIDLLDAAQFRRDFEAKAPMDALARSIPTQLVAAPDAVLAGMAAIAAEPDRYAIDYASRVWRPDQAA